MTAATITDRPSQLLAEENVLLTVSDGETFTTKLSSVLNVQCTWGEDMSQTGGSAGTAYPIDVAVSGRVITFQVNGVTDKKLYVTVKGRL